MAFGDPRLEFIEDALSLMREADRVHRRFFTVALGRTGSCWEPPVDIIERGKALVVRVALPGVAPDEIDVHTDGTRLHVRGTRPLRAGPSDSIHRLEIPYGCFERAIDLPAGRYEVVERQVLDGCLVLILARLG
jgi:HSP20 family protein